AAEQDEEEPRRQQADADLVVLDPGELAPQPRRVREEAVELVVRQGFLDGRRLAGTSGRPLAAHRAPPRAATPPCAASQDWKRSSGSATTRIRILACSRPQNSAHSAWCSPGSSAWSTSVLTPSGSRSILPPSRGT